MESSKMYCPSRCRYRIYQCVAPNYPVAWGVVYDPVWKYVKFRPYQSTWYHICTKEMVALKGSYGHGEFNNVLPYSVQIPYLPVRGRKLPHFMGGSIVSRLEICETSAQQSPWYRVCTKAMVISKGSYGHGDFKNVLP